MCFDCRCCTNCKHKWEDACAGIAIGQIGCCFRLYMRAIGFCMPHGFTIASCSHVKQDCSNGPELLHIASVSAEAHLLRPCLPHCLMPVDPWKGSTMIGLEDAQDTNSAPCASWLGCCRPPCLADLICTALEKQLSPAIHLHHGAKVSRSPTISAAVPYTASRC